MLNILSHQRSATQNNSEIPSYTCKNGQNKKHCWQLMLERTWGKGNTPALLVALQTCTAALESLWWFLRKLGNNLPQDPAIKLLGIYTKEAHSYHKDISSTMFIVALFVIARTWRQPRCFSMDQWIKKMWYIYTMGYYSVVKNNDVLKFTGK